MNRTGGNPSFSASVRALVSQAIARRGRPRAPGDPEQRFRELLELSSDWYWETDAEHRFTYISSGVKRALDLDSDLAIGRTRWELDYIGMQEGDWAAHRARLNAQEPFDRLQLRRRNRAGRTVHQLIAGRPSFDAAGQFIGYRGIGHDISAEIEYRQALRAQGDRLARIIETMAEGLMILDREGRFVLLNAAAECLVRTPRSQIQGLRYDQAPWRMEPVRPGVGSMPGASFERLRAGERLIEGACYVLAWPDGARTALRAKAARLDDEFGEFDGVIVTLEDVTQRRATDERLADTERELRRLNTELEERVAQRTADLSSAYRELESFSAWVSHDLRAPLRSISGFAHFLAADHGPALNQDARHLLDRILEGASHMGSLIDALLEFSRVSRHAVNRYSFDPTAVAREAIDNLAPAGAGRQVEFRLAALPECRADRILLRQVFANLLDNAVKYSARRAHAVIEIGSTTSGDRNVYYVRDNGAGFDMRFAAKLFNPFERLHSTSEFEGIGIGLAMAQRIVARHGGRMWAEGEPDAGATFYFDLGAAPGG
jgi:PAS domain S-box-containing protein